MKRIATVLGIGRGIWPIAVLAILLFSAGPAQATVDYLFFSVNGDTSLTTMTQGDMVGWGSNCAVGELLHWELWVDVDADGVIDDPGDRKFIEYDVHDGDSNPDGPPPDINPTPDGWYITNEMLIGMAPAHYIFAAWENSSHTMASRALTTNALPSPPNIIRGTVTVDGHPGPDLAFLGNRWIEADREDANFELWSGLTDANGDYEINFGAGATGVQFGIYPPDIPGFSAPNDTFLTVSGVIENIDFHYSAPSDSIYGHIRDERSNLITRSIYGYCGRQNGGGKDFQASNGYYVIYFGQAEYGNWFLSLGSETLLPDFLAPMNVNFDNSSSHSLQLDLICLDADAVLYARVTENDGQPSHSYKITAQSAALQCGSQAISGTGGNNIATVYITTQDPDGWRVIVNSGDDQYPIPPGYILDNGDFDNHSPGDTVDLNFIAGHVVSDTVHVDSGDPSPIWNNAWVSLMKDNSFYGSFPDNNGVFSITADTGFYYLGAYCQNYLSSPAHRPVHLLADTTGGLGFLLNQSHCRVWGRLINIQLPVNYPLSVSAYTAYDLSGYATSLHVDSLTGEFSGYLCDGNWSFDPPPIYNRYAPPSQSLNIDEIPDTVKYFEFVYIDPSSVDEPEQIPNEYMLMQNYPNPFNAQTIIGYGLPKSSNVTIEIYDLLGRQVAELPLGVQEAGYGKTIWNAANQPSGIYFYRIKAGEFSQMRKMLLLK
jgi:hypothetical protein